MSPCPIARSIVWSITCGELASNAVRRVIESLDLSIRDKIGNTTDEAAAHKNVGGLPVNRDLLEDLEDAEDTDDEPGMPELDEYMPEKFDRYLTASVLLPRGGKVLKGQVVTRKRDASGNLVGKANSNPILDMREYVVEFEGGANKVNSANI